MDHSAQPTQVNLHCKLLLHTSPRIFGAFYRIVCSSINVLTWQELATGSNQEWCLDPTDCCLQVYVFAFLYLFLLKILIYFIFVIASLGISSSMPSLNTYFSVLQLLAGVWLNPVPFIYWNFGLICLTIQR